MQQQRFGKHGQFWGAEFVLAMVADNEMFEKRLELGRKIRNQREFRLQHLQDVIGNVLFKRREWQGLDPVVSFGDRHVRHFRNRASAHPNGQRLRSQACAQARFT